jgi:hypothetical protein
MWTDWRKANIFLTIRSKVRACHLATDDIVSNSAKRGLPPFFSQ